MGPQMGLLCSSQSGEPSCDSICKPGQAGEGDELCASTEHCVHLLHRRGAVTTRWQGSGRLSVWLAVNHFSVCANPPDPPSPNRHMPCRAMTCHTHTCLYCLLMPALLVCAYTYTNEPTAASRLDSRSKEAGMHKPIYCCAPGTCLICLASTPLLCFLPCPALTCHNISSYAVHECADGDLSVRPHR